MPKETPQEAYRLVDQNLFDQNFDGSFDLFYRTETFEGVRFLKFAGGNPEHLEKVRKMFESNEIEEELYIQESDLTHYYTCATKTLQKFVLESNIPLEEKMDKIYDVSQNIMRDFFKCNASAEVLKNSDQIMEIMQDCLGQREFTFGVISQIISKDYYTYTHSVNVGLYAMTYGIRKKMDADTVKQLGVGGMLHDVGKSRISEKIINKEKELTSQEFQTIKKHAAYGEEILNTMGCFGQTVTQMAGRHHEKFDGTGYPRGLSREDIGFPAKVCKIMDVYDALTTRRSYKKRLQPINALMVMKAEMEGHFDPKIFESFIRIMGPQA